MDINKLTATKIKDVRNSLGLSMEKVAEELGLAKGNYSRMENGHVEITINRIEALAKIFNVPINALIPIPNSSTIQINNGENQNNGTQINHYTDPQMVQNIVTTIDALQEIIAKMKV